MAGAGNETTGRLIGWLAKVLAEHPRQRREIAEMKYLIQDIEENGPRTEERLPEEMQQ